PAAGPALSGPTARPEPQPAAGRAETDDWGSADDGWQAAGALARPGDGDVTEAGLPRRQPRAKLVPGAAVSAVPAATATGPARSAESIRGRLASYQRGVREGRETRRNLDDEAEEYGQQHPREEESQ
ncbi:MAG: hypothetical protein ACRDRZ_03175, partial [Pseudonocardiaceae bacterium]